MSDSLSDTRKPHSPSEAVAPLAEPSVMRMQDSLEHHVLTQVEEEQEEHDDDEPIDGVSAAVARNMSNKTLLCPITDLLKDYGPADIGPGEVADCKQDLLRHGVLVLYAEGLRWANHIHSTKTNGRAHVVFDNFRTIIDAIFDYAKGTVRGRGNNYNLVITSDDRSVSSSNHRMAASFVESGSVPGETSNPLSYIVPVKFTTRRTFKGRRKVRQHTVGGCYRIMSDDPRRMFMFAVSVENNLLSVWYFSRSHSVKALSFDWVEKDINRFIQVFLAFAFAMPKDLGIDPFVHKAQHISDHLKPGMSASVEQYIYEFPKDHSASSEGPSSRFFKTVKNMSDSHPHCISGRYTRIRKVIEIDGLGTEAPLGTDPVILKDVWLDEGSATEAENMVSIFDAIAKLISDSKDTWGEDWLDCLLSKDKRFLAFDNETKGSLKRLLSDSNYKLFFLTKVCAWKGEPSKKLSDTARIPEVDIFLPDEAVQGSKPGASSRVTESMMKSSMPVADGDRVDDGEGDKTTRHYRRKYQFRVVYKEVCSPLHEVGTLDAFMDMMLQTTEALLVLFCAGWVHRDISSGNILVFNDNGSRKVKLADLEFAKAFKPIEERHADPRTGTPFFIPYEIGANQYLISWLRGCRNPRSSFAQVLGLLNDTTSPLYLRLKEFQPIPNNDRVFDVPDSVTANIPKVGETVQYNFQHDLEAVWWVILYFITACVPWVDSREYARTVFGPDFMPGKPRIAAYRDASEESFQSQLHPLIKVAFDVPMERLRANQVEQALARQLFGQLDLPESYSVIHNDFATTIRDLIAGRICDEYEELDAEGKPIEKDKIDPLAWKSIKLTPSRTLTGEYTQPIFDNPVVSPPDNASRKRGRGDANKAQAVSNKRLKNAVD